MEKWVFERSNSGLPVFWESGGGMSNTGHADIICDATGNKKVPIFIRTGGELAIGKHALFVVNPGDVIVKLRRHHRDYTIEIYRVVSICKEEDGRVVGEVECVAKYDCGEWDNFDVPLLYSCAVEAAKQKSHIYHCRYPVYYRTK